MTGVDVIRVAVVLRRCVHPAHARAPNAVLGAFLDAVKTARGIVIRGIALEARVSLPGLARPPFVYLAVAIVVDADMILIAKLPRPALAAAGVHDDHAARAARRPRTGPHDDQPARTAA